MKKIIVALVLGLVVGGMGLGYLSKREINLLNPLGIIRGKVENETKRQYNLMGFLPTWMIGKTISYSNEIDELVFMGIEVDSEGNLVWDVQGKKINSSKYIELKEKIKSNGGKNILGIKALEDNVLEKIITSAKAQENLIKQVRGVVEAGNFDGVNVDFEFQGDPVRVLEADFISFLGELKKAGLGKLSVDVFANTINKGGKIALTDFVANVDEVVIMAYDFHRPGVNETGSVAPIRAELGDRSIWEVVGNVEANDLDKSKIIMAYPLYGYEWKTVTADFGSQIKRGWYQMASYARVKKILLDKKISPAWDELSMTPWISFEEEGEIHQIYYDDLTSLKAKIDVVRQNNLGGVALWALGYEGDDSQFWQEFGKF